MSQKRAGDFNRRPWLYNTYNTYNTYLKITKLVKSCGGTVYVIFFLVYIPSNAP